MEGLKFGDLVYIGNEKNIAMVLIPRAEADFEVDDVSSVGKDEGVYVYLDVSGPKVAWDQIAWVSLNPENIERYVHKWKGETRGE